MTERDDTDRKWAEFGQRLIAERRAARPTSVASQGFVDRMTSSAADPRAAEAESEDGKAPARPADGKR